MGQKRIIAFRFSAMGDVAMCVPVVTQFCAQHPDVQLIFVTRKHFKAMFPALPNLFIHPIEPKTKHKGFAGLYRLYKELKAFHPTHIADLHENVRTKVLKMFFSFSKLKISTLNKGRKERKLLLKHQSLSPLKPVSQRYVQVFHQLGFKFEFQEHHFIPKRSFSEQLFRFFPFLEDNETPCIGIFPFAQHLQKVYPLPLMEQVIQQLAQYKVHIFIFGAGNHERSMVEPWLKYGTYVYNTIDRMNLDLEMQLISQLQVMLSMDTAGMHMAAMFGVPVVSVWGATHPSAGFLGFGQSLENAVQLELSCRPCSIYGNLKCHRGDMACMHGISPQTIVNKVIGVLDLSVSHAH